MWLCVSISISTYRIAPRHCLIFKGSTCYKNSILYALSTVPSFWCQWGWESGFILPLIRAMTLNMSLLKRRTTPLDSSNLLWALSRELFTNKQVLFQFTTQQDVPEILQVVLDELKGHSTIASNILAIWVRNSTTCDTRGCSNIKEVKLDIIPLPLAKFICLPLERFLSSESLTGDNKWFCPARNGFIDSKYKRDQETKIVDSGSILILQLLRYDNFKGAVIKNNRVNYCSETPRLSISVDDQVCLFKEFNLKANINQTRTLQAGHYWAHIKDEDNRGWLKCNNTSVIATPFSVWSNSSSYVFFYTAN